jgi:hypothetical protein
MDALAFAVGDAVIDREHDANAGIVDDRRADGWLRVIGPSGRHEWAHESTVMLAPGCKRQRQPRQRLHGVTPWYLNWEARMA